MTLLEVKTAPDPRRAFDQWFAENRARIAKAAQSIWFRFHGRKPTWDELQDLLQDSALAAWEAVQGFRWICAGCGRRYDDAGAHARHARRCPRGSFAAAVPLVSIERRVFYQQGGAAQRAARLRAYGGDIMRRRDRAAVSAEDALRPLRVDAHEGRIADTVAALALARACR